jgi:DNA replicative helicase MCM subunit Mcm2 (Cdc46/Mcm family)
MTTITTDNPSFDTHNSLSDFTTDSNITPAILVEYHKKGFKLVPLSSDNKPVIKWAPIYENPNFWTAEKLVSECSNFKNVATVFGKTYIKDSAGEDQNLNSLDCDSQSAYSILTTPIEQIQDSALRSRIENLSSKPGTSAKSILEYLKQVTCVVKTRKPYGFHIYWLSSKQYKRIRTQDCKQGHEFEVKTDNGSGHATLPPSTHRLDKSFRYYHVGRTDKIATIDELYDLLLDLLKDCFVVLPTNRNGQAKNSGKIDSPSSSSSSAVSVKGSQQKKSAILYDLSEQMVEASIAYLLPYYIEQHRNDFALSFSGATWYANVSENSAAKILNEIASRTGDNEIESRLEALHATYQKTANGEPVTGAPTLVELIAQIKGSDDKDTAYRVVNLLKSLWHEDIQIQRNRAKEEAKNSGLIISVSEALRLMQGPANVTGKIVGINKVEPMISGTRFECSNCPNPPPPISHASKPVWRAVGIKEHSKCPSCNSENEDGTITAINEHIISLEIQLQDTNKINDIEQLGAILFEQDTENIQFNEIITLNGSLHVVRKYGNQANRLTSILFVESIERQCKEEEIKLTQTDIQEFRESVSKHREDGISLINDLVSITAPLTIGNDYAKKAMLIVAVNAGLPNDQNRLPKRIRSHAGLIGDPGLAKSQFLREIAELVPGSRVESTQSGTAVSMTVYIDKEDGGQRILRPGPVVLASGSILGLNEFGQIKDIDDNKYFTDSAEEGEFTVTKHGFNLHMVAHPSFIWTANPVGGVWKNPDRIDPAEFPILTQWGDRMDFIIPFIERTDEDSIREYTRQRRELAKRLGSFASDTLWLKKFLLYARSIKPDLPDNVRIILEDFVVEIAKQGVRGLPRRLDALERTAIGFAKLKLKGVVDEEDAYDTIDLFNEILKFYKQEVSITKNPKGLTFLQCLNLLEKTKPQKWTLDSLIERICSENPNIDLYIGEVKKSQYNYKIKSLKPLLNQHPNIQICNENPTVYAWVDTTDKIKPTNEGKDIKLYNNSMETSDVTDVTDGQNKKVEIKNTKCCDSYPDCSTINSSDITITTITSSHSDINSASEPPVDIKKLTKTETTQTIKKSYGSYDKKLDGNSNNLTSVASVASDYSSQAIMTNNKNPEKGLQITYPSAAHLLTNDDIEDIYSDNDNEGLEDSSSSTNNDSEGESS